MAVFDHYIMAVWVGNADGRGNPVFVGRTCAAPLLFQAIDSMRAAGHVHLGPHDPPPGANLKRVEFCAVSGQLAGPLCPHRIEGLVHSRHLAHHLLRRPPRSVYRRGHRHAPARARWHADVKGEIYEFWPSDLMRLFREAGLPRRRPPPFLPGSRPAAIYQAGSAPRIAYPAPGAVYQLSAGTNRQQLTLQARTDADVDQIYWFADKQFIGRAAPRDPVPWTPGARELLPHRSGRRGQGGQ